jgi:hypothetical protein
MRLRSFHIVEVTAFYAAEDESPVIPERHEGIDSGFQLAVDVVEAHFIFGAEDTPVIIDGRARGLRLAAHGEERYADSHVRWMDLDVGMIPPQLSELTGQMRAEAGKKWKAIRRAE